jgi:hypothetical protein
MNEKPASVPSDRLNAIGVLPGANRSILAPLLDMAMNSGERVLEIARQTIIRPSAGRSLPKIWGECLAHLQIAGSLEER